MASKIAINRDWLSQFVNPKARTQIKVSTDAHACACTENAPPTHTDETSIRSVNVKDQSIETSPFLVPEKLTDETSIRSVNI